MAEPGSNPGSGRGSRPEGSGAAAAKRCRVLVVDDDIDFLDSIEAVLSEEMDVVTCTSGEQALRVIASTRFHLVCADYKMPGMNGLELLDRVTQLHQTTSGLLITGSDNYSRVHGQSRYHVLLKPFDPERLLSLAVRLARLTEMKRSVQSLTDSVMAPESQRLSPPSSRRPADAAAAEPPMSMQRPSRVPPSSAVTPGPAAGQDTAPVPGSTRETKR